MYYIYEIPGVKVGCTQNMERRQKQQRHKGKMVLLESHTCIEDATRRERELQAEKGYRRDAWSYNHSVNNSKTVCQTPEAVAKRVANTDWIAQRAKQVANTDYSKASRGLKQANIERRKPIKAFLKGKYIGTYKSQLECSKELGLRQGGISNVLRDDYPAKQYNGYTFEFVQ